MRELERESVPGRVCFRFRLDTNANTVEGILLDYIQCSQYHPSFSAKEMVLKALKAFWLPYAYDDCQNLQVAPTFVKKLVREAILSLKQHIRELELMFEIESETSFPLYMAPAIPIPSHQSQQQPTNGTTDKNSDFAYDHLAIKSDPF